MKKLKGYIDNEQLITLVKSHPIIYNPFLKNYRNKRIRFLTWQKISKSIGVDIEFCQTRWRGLRDRYKKEKSGSRRNINKPFEYLSSMSFMDEIYEEYSGSRPQEEIQPVIESYTSQADEPPLASLSNVVQSIVTQPSTSQPFTSQPVIITVPKNPTTLQKNPKALRPIAPKITGATSLFIKSSVNGNQESNIENESEEPSYTEPEVLLVTPTLFDDHEKTLFKKCLNPPKRKANFSNNDDEGMVEAKRQAIEEDTQLRRQESEYRMGWEEKEHFLRVKCQEEEHQIKMQVELAKLKVEEENLKLKQQKFMVLIAKEAYFKSIIKTEIEDKNAE